jgi:hypothetical protein
MYTYTSLIGGCAYTRQPALAYELVSIFSHVFCLRIFYVSSAEGILDAHGLKLLDLMPAASSVQTAYF